MKPSVLIGLGPNNVAIIGMIFVDWQHGKLWVNAHLPELEWVERKTGLMATCIDHEDLLDRVFTSYYGGCGECYSLLLQEVDYRTPLVPFDLD